MLSAPIVTFQRAAMSAIVDQLAIAPRYHQSFHPDAREVREELECGLRSARAWISPKFLYDPLGSCLFGAITQLPEYYPTRTERQILAQHAGDIARRVGRVEALIDLGAGDCQKAEQMFGRLQPRQYVPVDISIEYLRAAVTRLHASWPGLDIVALGQDFSRSLVLPDEVPGWGRLFFYPGSSIGNWAPPQALAMLRQIRAACADGAGSLLIGVDRVKDEDVLLAAYDDPLQITAAFNRNLLLHVNRLLGSDFRLEDWRHEARFDPARSRIEMHLQAQAPVTVSWPEGGRQFAAGETIHTESSHKYTPRAFGALLEDAGFTDIAHWTDDSGWFSVFHART